MGPQLFCKERIGLNWSIPILEWIVSMSFPITFQVWTTARLFRAEIMFQSILVRGKSYTKTNESKTYSYFRKSTFNFSFLERSIFILPKYYRMKQSMWTTVDAIYKTVTGIHYTSLILVPIKIPSDSGFCRKIHWILISWHQSCVWGILNPEAMGTISKQGQSA